MERRGTADSGVPRCFLDAFSPFEAGARAPDIPFRGLWSPLRGSLANHPCRECRLPVTSWPYNCEPRGLLATQPSESALTPLGGLRQ